MAGNPQVARSGRSVEGLTKSRTAGMLGRIPVEPVMMSAAGIGDIGVSRPSAMCFVLLLTATTCSMHLKHDMEPLPYEAQLYE